MKLLKSESSMSNTDNEPDAKGKWKEVEKQQKAGVLEKEKENLRQMLKNYETEIDMKKAKIKDLKGGDHGKVETVTGLKRQKKKLKREIQEAKDRVNRSGKMQKGKSYKSLRRLNEKQLKKSRKKSDHEDAEEKEAEEGNPYF